MQETRSSRNPAHADRTVIFNADDYGASPQANAAIRDVLAGEVVRSVTVLANAPAACDAALLPSLFPHVSVGVHLNLTEYRPLLPPREVPTLVDRAGGFLPGRILLRRCLLGLVSEDEVLREFLTQLERVAALAGPPSHLDSHQNVHAYPVVFSAFLRLCACSGVRRVRSQRIFRPSCQPRSLSPARRLREWIKLRRENRARRSGLSAPDFSLASNPAYNRSAACLPDLFPWWSRVAGEIPPGVTEVIAHPGIGEAETRLYASPAFAGLLEGSALRLASFAVV
ncbi:MAG: ChbG/HpnK family deacetylase [Planctomycetota bacterium]